MVIIGFSFSWFTGIGKTGYENPKSIGDLSKYISSDISAFIYTTLLLGFIYGVIIFIAFPEKRNN